MSNQPVVFNIQYTPYSLPRSATSDERARHADERAFFDMSGGKNVYDYITTEGKQTGGKRTALEYLQKSTGVFNDRGMISEKDVREMKARVRANKGNIWHGFISLNEEESYKIDTPEKCIELIKRTFPSFLQDMKLSKDNVDLMCALHLDRPHHLHIHFVFWEKEPKYKDKDGKPQYRRRGKVDKAAIDNMFVRLGLFVDGRNSGFYRRRDKAIKELRGVTAFKTVMGLRDEVKKEIIALAKDMPKEGRTSYGSKNMAPYRERVDRIVQMLLSCDGRARAADMKFYQELAKREQRIKNICGTLPFAFSNQNVSAATMEEEPRYHNEIDEKNIHLIEELEADYRRRQGNLVLNLAKRIKPELLMKRRRPNDKILKKALGIAKREVSRSCKKFFATFGQECDILKRDFTHRLQDIEDEIERERDKKNNVKKKEGDIKD